MASSNPANVGIVVAPHNYLPDAQVQQDLLRIGVPWAGRDFADGRVTSQHQPVATDEHSFIPITQTQHIDGRKLRLLIALNPDYFLNHMSSVLDHADGTVEILRYDGILLMSTNPDESAGSLHEYVVRDLLQGQVEAGALEQDYENDAQVLTAFRASRLYPFVVVTHLARTAVLRPWLTEVKTLLTVLLPVMLAIVFLTIAFYRRQMEAAAQRDETERLLRINATVFEASSEAIIITDAQANILSVNTAFCSITGYTEQEVQSRNPRLLSSGQHDQTFYAHMWATLTQTGKWQGEMVNHRKDGTPFDAHISITRSLNRHGQLQHYVGVMTDISQQKQNDTLRNELNRDFVSFLENTSDFIYFKDKDGRFRFASQTLADITGNASWRDLIGKHDLEVFPPETARIYHHEEFPIFHDGKPLLNKIDPYFDAQGHKGWVSTNKWPLFDSAGNVVGLFGISRDITAQKQNEAKLELAASVFSNSREGILITNLDGTIIDVNEAFSDITGYSHDEVIGKNPRIMNSGRQSKEHYVAMWQDLILKGHWYGEVWNRRKTGEVYAEMLTISTVRNAQGQAMHYLALFSDITMIKEHEQKLEHIAHYDTLTNLPNRVLLADRLSQSMTQAHRRGQKLAVVFLDLDGFKAVNDTYGHEAGDQLLMALSLRMKQALREGDTLARIGGDEFVAVLVDLTDATECEPILKRLLCAAAEPIQFGPTSLQVSASLGVTFYPQGHEMDADQLQRQADQAMYQAKVSGKNRYHFFDAEHDRSVRGHHESLERIRQALEAGEFVLYYQPKINMQTGQLIGAEALIRWQHPERGLLAPGQFLPTIENHSLAVDLGEWVINQALGQMQDWHGAGLDLPVSVNVGARQLQQHDFVLRLQRILSAYPGIQPGCLELEVLETSALEDIDLVSQVIETCRELGVMFALDDFGTGYSSLTYLKRLPVAQLKIDRSFVSDMIDNPDNLAILQGVVGLAKAFNREVIAEGVESVAQGRILLQLGCELGQGFGIARPMSASSFLLWVSTWRQAPPWLESAPT
ncbi:MAG: diguanylate cyclase/phosphodiesterase with PAS/PAC sensor(s) [Comamonadaceae bacterium]|nr:MAG: diguanylate cyclase/phosphodiesterase with PAS/PAC sensor(s) [Comamonadaceae bacterium]